MLIPWLDRHSLSFPPLEHALDEPNGLLAVGGDLTPERLLAAYRHGCFPWFEDGQEILWWAPNPRTVVIPQQLHLPKSLKKVLRRGVFSVTFDQAFNAVIEGCAGPRNYTDQTWITEEMQQAYCQLHQLGHAHSVEVWQDGQLVGGLYGLAIGKVFYGESMFSRRNDASKVGFATLVSKLTQWGFELIDCQMHTEHLARFGAIAIDRADFAARLQRLCPAATNADWVA